MVKRALVLFIKDNIKELSYKTSEMNGLLKSLNIEMESMTVRIDSITKSTYIGSGTLTNIKQFLEYSFSLDAGFDYLITDFNLTGIQKENLEENLNISVLDKTLVILKVFESRARSKESKLQVEIAKLQYQASQLVNKDANYSQVTSGSGHNKGSGEKDKELSKRAIHQAIHRKKIELREIKKARKTGRILRKNNEIPTIAVVGYTNAGKSTLINYLMSKRGDINKKLLYTEDLVFATLETSTRLINIYGYPSFLLTDTVGFMRDLPHFLINAFRSTLEEIKEADLILEVVDISDEDYKTRMSITSKILENLGVKDVNKITFYNKCDLIKNEFPFIPNKDEMFISLKDEDQDFESIVKFILHHACKNWKKHKVLLPYECNHYAFLSRNFVIKKIEKENGIEYTAYLSPKYFNEYSNYLIF